MNNNNTNKVRTILLSFMIMMLQGCGAGDTSMDAGRGGGAGMLTLSITDAAVDDATEVWVTFTGISIQPADGETIVVPPDQAETRTINLLSLQGTRSETLLDDVVLPAGQYDWIRLHVDSASITFTDGSVHELIIPSGSESGLKINTAFSVDSHQDARKTIDFDLRKSVVESGNTGKYELRPTLRLIDDDLSGVISGSIEQTWLTLPACSDNDPDTYNAVYVFAGFNIDVDGLDMDSALYVTSANVIFNPDSGNYEYEVGFVEAGNYTVALTCQTDFDRAGVNDNLVYVVSEEVTVTSSNEDDDDDDDEGTDIIR